MYADDCEGLDPETIDQYDRTYLNDADDSDSVSDFDSDAGGAVDGPTPLNPLENDEEKDFFEVLGQVVEQGIEPVGYGLHPDECEDGIYPQFEYIRVGKRAGKTIQVSLSSPVWRSRAVLWVQALRVLAHFDKQY